MSIFSIFQRKPQIEKLLELAIKKGAENVECTQSADGDISFHMLPSSKNASKSDKQQHHQQPQQQQQRPRPGDRGHGGRPN